MRATHDGTAWVVRVEGADGTALGNAKAAAIEQIDESARTLIAGEVGIRPEDVGLRIEIQLDPVVQARLDRIELMRRHVEEDVHAVALHLGEGGVCSGDIHALLSDTVNNQEIAQHGLRRYPQAIAVRFDDRGRFTTTTCRACLDKDRGDYAALPPEGLNTLVMQGPVMCDVCFEDRS
ncbi:MAG TPA: hypothetical protein VK611_19085 [Acidimicrobiales bacterium]|nr:hypothetical protein [Acidimicrobiales bacterium]